MDRQEYSNFYNLAVVTVLQSGRTRDSTLATISRNIFMLASKFDICLKVCHVPGKINVIADLLSRWEDLEIQRVKLAQMVPAAEWVEIKKQYFELDLKILFCMSISRFN